MLISSNIQVVNKVTIIGLIENPAMKLMSNKSSKIFENSIFEMKVVNQFYVSFKHYLYIPTSKNIFNDFFNLGIYCDDIEPKYRRIRERGFCPTVKVVSLISCMLCINLFKKF